MTWWAWTVLWVLLVAGAVLTFFLLGRSLWRKASALVTELGEAADRLQVVSAELGALAAVSPQEEPAVFADPAALRQQRILARRAAARSDTGRGVGRRRP